MLIHFSSPEISTIRPTAVRRDGKRPNVLKSD